MTEVMTHPPTQSSGRSHGEQPIPWRTFARCSTAEARARIPFEHAARLLILPLGLHRVRGQEVLSIATLQDCSQQLISELKFIAELEIRSLPALCTDPARAIYAAYHGDGRALQQAASAAGRTDAPKRVEFDLLGRSADTEVFDALLAYAIARGASDIHFTPSADGAEVKLRIDGELYGHGHSLYPKDVHEKIVSRIKVLSSLDLTCRFLPQDGRFSIPLGQEEADVRVSFLPTIHGEKIVLRLIGDRELRSIDDLGLSQKPLNLLRSALKQREGIILFVGPTGSGKSTTMYAAISSLREQNLSVVTVEDPVELKIEGISQTSLDEERGLTYPLALRSVLRQDPDVILVGEIRDSESAKIALQASQTGHLLLSTVHAGSIDEAFERLKLLEIPPARILPVLQAIFVQRLVPGRCLHCTPADQSGCRECGATGRSGRVLLTEALAIPRGVKAITYGDERGVGAALAERFPNTYFSFQESAREAYAMGWISEEELLKFCE